MKSLSYLSSNISSLNNNQAMQTTNTVVQESDMNCETFPQKKKRQFEEILPEISWRKTIPLIQTIIDDTKKIIVDNLLDKPFVPQFSGLKTFVQIIDIEETLGHFQEKNQALIEKIAEHAPEKIDKRYKHQYGTFKWIV